MSMEISNINHDQIIEIVRDAHKHLSEKYRGKELMKDYPNLEKYLELCDKYYHNKGEALISDELYDNLRTKIESSTIGGKDGGHWIHANIVYSMQSFYADNIGRIKAELKKYVEIYNRCVIDHKIDGVPVELIYRNGCLHRAITRGDGRAGLDVTAVFIRFVKNVPFIVEHREAFEVVGEIAIPKQVKEIKDGVITYHPFSHPEYKSARGLVGAVLLSDDFDVNNVGYKADFIPYDLSGIFYTTWSDLYSILRLFGFKVKPWIQYPEDKLWTEDSIIMDILNNALPASLNSKYECDGVNIKINDIDIRRKLGYTQKFPKYQFAIKHVPPTGESSITRIVWKRGLKTDRISPVIHIKPITIGNKVINKVNGHNLDFIKRFNIHIGDSVTIKLPGATAPQLAAVNSSHDEMDEFIPPTVCPRCHGEVKYKFPHLICINNCK